MNDWCVCVCVCVCMCVYVCVRFVASMCVLCGVVLGVKCPAGGSTTAFWASAGRAFCCLRLQSSHAPDTCSLHVFLVAPANGTLQHTSLLFTHRCQ